MSHNWIIHFGVIKLIRELFSWGKAKWTKWIRRRWFGGSDCHFWLEEDYCVRGLRFQRTVWGRVERTRKVNRNEWILEFPHRRPSQSIINFQTHTPPSLTRNWQASHKHPTGSLQPNKYHFKIVQAASCRCRNSISLRNSHNNTEAIKSFSSYLLNNKYRLAMGNMPSSGWHSIVPPPVRASTVSHHPSNSAPGLSRVRNINKLKHVSGVCTLCHR